MRYPDLRSRPLNLVNLARISGASKPFATPTGGALPIGANTRVFGLHGMGDTADDLEAQAAAAAQQEAQNFFDDLVGGYHAGQAEADIIVVAQNKLTTHLDEITNQILVGKNPSLETLQYLMRLLREYAGYFYKFVSDPRFVDGRASFQALNTVMPYIDGTCGYSLVTLRPTLSPSQYNCLTWGAGTIGGPGTDGMLGAIRRAIEAKGGTVPGGGVPTDPSTLPGGPIMAGFSTPMAVALGVLVLMLWKKKGGF